MVVFTCSHCGDSVQKPKVEKHYETKCRNNFPDLCCVDCLKDFRGHEFQAHTKCISEAERYGGKGFVAKAGQNKGEKKQNAWVEIVQSVLDENKKLSGQLRNLLERVAQQPNTPRKKPKFINFVTSMDRRVNQKDLEAAWNLLSAKLDLLKSNVNNRQANGNSEEKSEEKEKLKEEVQASNIEETHNGFPPKTKNDMKKEENKLNESNGHLDENNEENTLSKKERKEKKKREKYEAQLKEVAESSTGIEVNDVEVRKKGKKRKHNEANGDTVLATEEISDLKKTDNDQPEIKKTKDSAVEFDWTNAISSVMGKKGKDISLKKLQKKVLSEYCVVYGVSEITERILKKFSKSLHKMHNLKVENDKVMLVEVEE